MNSCTSCGADNSTALWACAGCRSVAYCNASCQVVDWSRHYLHCNTQSSPLFAPDSNDILGYKPIGACPETPNSLVCRLEPIQLDKWYMYATNRKVIAEKIIKEEVGLFALRADKGSIFSARGSKEEKINQLIVPTNEAFGGQESRNLDLENLNILAFCVSKKKEKKNKGAFKTFARYINVIANLQSKKIEWYNISFPSRETAKLIGVANIVGTYKINSGLTIYAVDAYPKIVTNVTQIQSRLEQDFGSDN